MDLEQTFSNLKFLPTFFFQIEFAKAILSSFLKIMFDVKKCVYKYPQLKTKQESIHPVLLGKHKLRGRRP
jgi:hypothetical protein